MKIQKYLLSLWMVFVLPLHSLYANEQINNLSESANETITQAKVSVKDAVIKAKLDTIFSLNKELGKFRIQTTANNGIVVLSGTVKTLSQKELAEVIAKNTEDVVSVINNIKVDKSLQVQDVLSQTAQQIADATITAIVKSQLLVDSRTSGLKIKVITKNSVVTLMGDVPSTKEKRIAEQLAAQVKGVRSVTNNLVVAKE